MYERRKSLEVFVGNKAIGGNNSIAVQSMTNVSTMDTDRSIKQAIQLIEAGCSYVRFSVRSIREAENLKNIKSGLCTLGYTNPLIADIHFDPKIASVAAKIVEKVRINPGNFLDSTKKIKIFEYSDYEYEQELKNIRKYFIPFLNICKKYNTVVRIGVNHGSLSTRIVNRYGNTSQGMVESCMEFLRICIAENFFNLVVSIKASNVFVMVQTVRLLVKKMHQIGVCFPLHLGVTEAGEGESGRIKSAVGIGTLLMEGIGDTIRVSLSENPEVEILIARLLIDYVEEKKQLFNGKIFTRISQKKRLSNTIYVILDRSSTDDEFSINPDLIPDFIYVGEQSLHNISRNIFVIVDFKVFLFQENTFPLFKFQEKNAWVSCEESIQFIELTYQELTDEIIFHLKNKPQTIVIIYSTKNNIYEQKLFIYALMTLEINNSFILRVKYDERNSETLQIKASVDCGPFLLDGLVDGIMIKNMNHNIFNQSVDDCVFGILQATGRKITKTEYIACPGCGRTLFDLQSTLKKVKLVTSHLKGLKIAVMGCIINGLGEMANADYGYIGSKAGMVNLYKGDKCVKKNIPEIDAADKLLQIINFFIKNVDEENKINE
jgi:(E)-4-hydroxy-3-methylbut-2-enyl-diphosphate synthase